VNFFRESATWGGRIASDWASGMKKSRRDFLGVAQSPRKPCGGTGSNGTALINECKRISKDSRRKGEQLKSSWRIGSFQVLHRRR